MDVAQPDLSAQLQGPRAEAGWHDACAPHGQLMGHVCLEQLRWGMTAGEAYEITSGAGTRRIHIIVVQVRPRHRRIPELERLQQLLGWGRAASERWELRAG